MRRTTVYLDSDLEVQLKLEAKRRGQPMAELIREALRAYLDARPEGERPPGAGEFRSGRSDTADRVDEALGELGFASGGS